MYLPDSAKTTPSDRTLAILESAASSPAEACHDDPEVREAFDQSLRELAEDILEFHPGLAHLLIGLSDSPCPTVHGQN